MFFRQIQKHGDNFSYLIGDYFTLDAAVIDSSYNSGEIIKILKKENFKLKFIINTHGHSDHTAGNQELKSLFGGKLVGHESTWIPVDLKVLDNAELTLGSIKIKIIHTPGHTPDSICLLINNQKLLTGDTLFVGECGRTDLAGGNSKNMYFSLFNKILSLPDETEVFPGHDYGPLRYSTIGKERSSNYTLQPRTVKEFLVFMNEP